MYLGGDFGGGQVDPFNVGRTTGNIRVGSDRAANYGLFVGYRMGDIRLEGEFFSTGTSQLNLGVIEGDPASTAALSSGIARSSAYMVNAYYDIPLGNTIKPYVGAGVGLMTSSFIGSSVVNPGPTDETYDASRSGLAYQLKAGFSYAMDSKTDVFLQYRYLTAPGSSGLNQIGDYSNQSFEGGLRIGL
jgi:opacity protein-like surface antigen